MKKSKLTKKDWAIILDLLNKASADIWDEASYGERPDIEAVITKVQERVYPSNNL